MLLRLPGFKRSVERSAIRCRLCGIGLRLQDHAGAAAGQRCAPGGQLPAVLLEVVDVDGRAIGAGLFVERWIQLQDDVGGAGAAVGLRLVQLLPGLVDVWKGRRRRRDRAPWSALWNRALAVGPAPAPRLASAARLIGQLPAVLLEVVDVDGRAIGAALFVESRSIYRPSSQTCGTMPPSGLRPWRHR